MEPQRRARGYFGSNRSPTFDSDPPIEEKIVASFEILLAAGADINAKIADSHSRTAWGCNFSIVGPPRQVGAGLKVSF